MTAEKILEKHLLLMLKRTDESYVSVDEMKQQPEWQATINAMLEYGEMQALRIHDVGNPRELLTALSKKQKRELLEKSQMFEALTFKQICALIWWEWFKPKKINKFYEMLQIGKAARFAFLDAQRCR